MSEKELQNGHEFDGEPDEIEEVSYNRPPNSTTSHPFNGNNSSNEANNFSHSSNSFQAANAPDGAGSNGKKTFGLRSVEPLSREEERELAGHDGETDELLTSEHRIKQDNEGAETHPVSEKPEVRTFSVLMGTGAVLGILGFFWFVFFAPKPVRQQAKTTNPKPVQVSEDESGELKSRLAFQDQQRALEVQPPEPKNRSTPASKPTPAPKPAPAARRSEPPRPVQNFNPPPPRTVQTIPPPQPPLPRPAQQPAPPPPRRSPTPLPRPVPPPAPLALRPAPPPPSPSPEKVDPYERWAQLASLGQSRGQAVKELNTEGISASSATFPSAIAPGMTAANYPAVPPAMPVPAPPPSTVAIAPTAAQAPPPSAVAIAPVPLPQQQPVSPISQNPQPVLVSSPKSPQSAAPMQEIPAIAIGVPDSAVNAKVMSPGEAGILNRTTGENTEGSTAMREIAIGSSAQAKVIVPMIWDEAGQSPTAGRFAVQLTEDVIATDGAIALPSGTVLITQVENVTRGNRLVSQSVVALVYPDSAGRIQQVPIPPGYLIVRGIDNQPLIADSLFDRGSEIAKADILVGILGSLGRVGEIINRPAQETFSQQSGFFGSTAVKTTTSPEPNILAAALEGFFTPTAQRLRERSDRNAQELLKRGNVAIVPEGTQVSVFVNAFVTVQR